MLLKFRYNLLALEGDYHLLPFCRMQPGSTRVALQSLRSPNPFPSAQGEKARRVELKMTKMPAAAAERHTKKGWGQAVRKEPTFPSSASL
jgi:hypothetical protein